MVSIVASTSRSANSLAMCASHSAPRSGTSFGKLWVWGISTFCESSIFIQLSPFYLETAHLHFIGWRPRGLRLPIPRTVCKTRWTPAPTTLKLKIERELHAPRADGRKRLQKGEGDRSG